LILGELYSATSNEPIFGVTDPLIQRSFSQGKQLRTQQHDSNWLKSINKKNSFLFENFIVLIRSIFYSNNKYWSIYLYIFS
jgi:hypothetical protein